MQTRGSATPSRVQNRPQLVNVGEIRSLVTDLPVGTRLRFTYKREEPRVLMYLQMLLENDIVSSDDRGVKMLIYAIVQSGNWEFDSNRTFEVKTTAKFEVDLFVTRVGREIESFEVLQ